MRTSDATISFGEWLPDLPDLEVGKRSGLIDARNVRPVNGSYTSYLPMVDVSVSTPSSALPRGAIYPSQRAGVTWEDKAYVGFNTGLQEYDFSADAYTDKTPSPYSSTLYWRFTQFDELVIATNDANVPQVITIGAAGNFANLAAAGTAPVASAVGTVGRFVILGDLEASGGVEREHNIQWCAIDDPTDWPTPGSADAQGKQAGLQQLNKSFGSVTGIWGGDQYGIVLQQGGMTRMTYIGGDVVWQFDEFSKTHGCICPNASIMINDVLYFPSQSGFVATNGAEIVPIGKDKVDDWFFGLFDTAQRNRMYVAHDPRNKLIVWNFASTSATGGQPDYLLFYSYAIGS